MQKELKTPKIFKRNTNKEIKVLSRDEISPISGFLHVVIRDNTIKDYDFTIHVGDVSYIHSSLNNLKRGKLTRNNVKISRKDLNKFQLEFFKNDFIKEIENTLNSDSVYTDIEHLIKTRVKPILKSVFISKEDKSDGKNIRVTFNN